MRTAIYIRKNGRRFAKSAYLMDKIQAKRFLASYTKAFPGEKIEMEGDN